MVDTETRVDLLEVVEVLPKRLTEALVLSRFFPEAHGTFSTVIPHAAQSTRRVA